MMSSQTDTDMFIKMEVINDDWSTDEVHPFQIKHFPFNDEREDACTQTDSNSSACKHGSEQQRSPALEVPEIGSEESTGGDSAFFEDHFLSSPSVRRRTSHYYKDKTPKTVKMLKEKHRENERLRHHSLNQHLRLICKNVPGSAEDGKETKVVMMQRIISYVAYLENTVRFMCSQLNLKPDRAWVMLTSSIKDIEKSGVWRNDFVGVSSDDSRDSEVFTSSISRRLKLSSPTIDSTTDPSNGTTPQIWSPKIEEYSCQESQDSSVPTSSFYLDIAQDISNDCDDLIIPHQNIVIDAPENFDALLDTADNGEDLFELPSSTFENKLMKTPDEVKWLGSPDRSPSHQQEKSENDFGIRCDPKCLDEQSCDMMPTLSVSPDKVMPKTAIRQEIIQSPKVPATSASSNNTSKPADPEMKCSKSDIRTWYRIISCEDGQQILRSITPKKSSPKRTPLLNVTNWTELPLDFLKGEHKDVESLGQEISDYSSLNSVSSFAVEPIANATVSKEVDTAFNDISKQELTAESEKVIKDASSETATKLDLRKSSWMNGFMMYSRIHRKRFIRENPGLHTSAISRMMGQTWRGMSSKHQQPYRDQARVCSQELQRMLDESCQT